MRWIFNGVTLLSAVLCVASAGLWARSYWRYDSVAVPAGNLAFWYEAVSGRVQLTGMRIVADSEAEIEVESVKIDSREAGYFRYATSDDHGGSRWFAFNTTALGSRVWERQVIMPHAVPAVIFAILPAITAIRWHRRRRTSAHGFPVAAVSAPKKQSGNS